ncbi:MAG: hypothetical protein WBA22_02290 [Candidatus Methanofastidiosia archaeon]
MKNCFENRRRELLEEWVSQGGGSSGANPKRSQNIIVFNAPPGTRSNDYPNLFNQFCEREQR